MNVQLGYVKQINEFNFNKPKDLNIQKLWALKNLTLAEVKKTDHKRRRMIKLFSGEVEKYFGTIMTLFLDIEKSLKMDKIIKNWKLKFRELNEEDYKTLLKGIDTENIELLTSVFVDFDEDNEIINIAYPDILPLLEMDIFREKDKEVTELEMIYKKYGTRTKDNRGN